MLIQEDYFKNIFNTVHEAILILDEDMRVLSANRSFFTIFKVDSANTIGSLLYDLGNGQWNIPYLRMLLEDVLPKNDTVDDYKIEHTFESIGHKTMLLNACKIREKKNDQPIILLAIEDITERRKMEEAHSKLAAIVEFADDAIIGEDLKGIIVSWNGGAEIAYGYDAKEIVGKSVSSLMPSSRPDEYKEVLAKIARGETIKHYETQRRRKDGQEIDVSLTISPVKDTSGEIISASTIARDITERKEIEAGLEKTRKELVIIKKTADEASEFAESVINTVREPLISLDQDLRVVTVSRSFYEFFKVKPEETVGKLIYDLGNKQWDIPKLRELLETILPQKTSFDNYEVEHDFATIGRRTMLLNARQIKRGKGKERIILLAIEDITERKRLEDFLTESEERYRRVFETASDGIVLLDKREGTITHANPATETMLGYSKEECIGKKLQDIGVSLDMSDFPAIMKDLNKSGILNYEDVPVKTKSGQDIDTDIYMVDRARLAQCNIRDVTERRLADEILKEEKRFIENALNTLQDIFFVFDLEGRFLRWNKTLNAVTGYTDSEIALMKPVDLFRNDDIRRISEAIQAAAKEGSVNVEALFVTKDGRQIPYEFSAALLTDAHGKPIGISGVGRDITERKKAEVALRESEERFRQIAENTKEWIWEINCDGLFTYASHVVEEILGYKPEEVVGKKHFFDFFPSDKREQIKEEVFEFFAAKKAFVKYVSPNVHKNGSIVLIETSGLPILDNRGDLFGYRGINIDITEYRKLEEQLRHAQKMEAVGTLAGGIAHDFNNILNAILGYGNMVMDSLEVDSPSKENMSEVLIAADRGANLTKRLLVFSRKQVVEVKPNNINELIHDLQKMLVRIIRENIELSLDLADSPLIVRADAGQIEQVLINLATNGSDAMPEGGCLTIGTGIQKIDDEYVAAYGYGKPGTYALITVADTGQGMDTETQKKLFEPFFTTKGIGEGTGLGLAISYGIIKQHSGYIKVYSELGKGTIFKIYLPLVEETADHVNKAEAAVPVNGGNETILVAEDDASLRKLKRIVLESFGYSVISADDGEDAIAKFMENRDKIQLAILDVIMPKKNGQEVSEAIKKVSPRTRILFTSGYTMDTLTNTELTESGFDFLLKPISSKDLLRKVREVLDR